MSRPTLFAILIFAFSVFPGTNASSRGAYTLESQYSFPIDETSSVIGPFVDSDGNPWVLSYQFETQFCLFIGPFDQDDPPVSSWQLPSNDPESVPTQCIGVEPGPGGALLVRGFIPPDPLSEDPPYGFIASLDEEFEVNWLVFDEPQIELGVYGEPFYPMAWSPERARVVTFFQGYTNLGTNFIRQLHGMSIADSTGIVRRTISSWGDASNGSLQSLLVMPEDGKFLVIADSNGTEFLVYDGLERIESYPAGDVDWTAETVDHAKFAANSNLYIVHHPRLPPNNNETSLTSLSGDGEIQYYSRSLSRTVLMIDPETEQSVEWTLGSPILSYVTDSTVTLIRSSPIEFVLHVYDNFNGSEMAIQPLGSVDENPPTHMIDARRPDRLILMTVLYQNMVPVSRLVDVIVWDADLQTPGEYPGGEDPSDFLEPSDDVTGLDSDPGDTGIGEVSDLPSGSENDSDSGCGCELSGNRPFPFFTLSLFCFLLFVFISRNRASPIH